MNLRTEDGWDELTKLLSGERIGFDGSAAHAAAKTIIRQLQAHGIRSAIVEFPYHDRDFADEYIAFHARLFRPGRKACTRIHFLTEPSENLDHILAREVRDEHLRADHLRGLSTYGAGGVYRGFCVVRPTRDTPIGFTVIARPKDEADFGRKLWAQFTTHILGQEFRVNGFPFIEQDGRTGSCAQAALWMVLRYLWAVEDGPWRSIPQLTVAATTVPDEINASSVPTGSGGLPTSNIIRALRAADRIPHYFCGVPALHDGHFMLEWKNELDPIAIACRYLDSNIPVILLVGHTSGRLPFIAAPNVDRQPMPYERLDIQNGHALTAVGYYGDVKDKSPKVYGDDHLHIAQWVDGLIVHNDQAGPYVALSRSASRLEDVEEPQQLNQYTCADIIGLVVPLPDEVFLRADKAEEYAWLFVTEKADAWWATHFQQPNTEPAAKLDSDQLVARTFLALGYHHYQWLSSARAHATLLNVAAALHHPRYVWITEFYSMVDNVPDFDQVVAHVVADATASSESSGKAPYNAFMFGHVPGRAFALLTSGRPGGAKVVMHELPHDHAYQSFHLRGPSLARK